MGVIFLVVYFFLPAHAQWSAWISPGQLSQAHTELEGIKNCTQCHSSTQGLPDQKCLNCHTDIAKKIKDNQGYHAVQTSACYQCHNEHQGRAYDLLGLERLQFKHDQTGWVLTGKHASLACETCHHQKRLHAISGKKTKKNTFLQANQACVTCHQDIHQSQRPRLKRCQDCHHAYNFNQLIKQLRFDHNRETNFPLTGAHQTTECKSCHINNQWAPLSSKKCSDCHNDPHQGRFGSECQKCHSTDLWKVGSNLKSPQINLQSFDHQKTRFPLTGQHRSVTCAQCHGETIGKMKNFAQCNGCHNNPHGNAFRTQWKPKQCTDCHLTEAWQILSFLHNKDSRYPLTGKHVQVACEKCHQNQKYRWLQRSPNCNACHQDIHRKQFLGQTCSACHNTQGFSNMQFNHNTQSQFKLEGAHQYVTCERCHDGGKFKPLNMQCQACHNDFHRGELGSECKNCHTPTRFNKIHFDHNQDASFKLTGKHRTLDCNQCHQNYKYKLGIKQCSDCHIDVHRNSFGKNCQKCHTPHNFTVKKSYHDFGEYQLKGVHDQLNCLVCHGPQQTARPLQPQCSACHQDPHMNSFGQHACQDCHGQNTWLPSQFRHSITGFELSGAHRFLSCDQCHVNRIFGGLPNECSFCHLKDFAPPSIIPQHAAGNINCKDCHRTYGWRPTK